jgi:type II secretory pathway pseudopilin PulG
MPNPVSRITHHASRSLRAFTMIEIAVSLAIIGFALVAIIGVLPYGMNVQKDNREETIINQDSTVFINAIRNGVQGLDDLTNYVMAITNEVWLYPDGGMTRNFIGRYGYTLTNSSTSPQFPLTNGFRIVGLLSTPKYLPYKSRTQTGFISNNVVAYIRSMSGPANEKFPQISQSMQDLAFSYLMTSEVVPYWTNYYDQSWTNYAAFPTNSPEYVARHDYSMVTGNLQANLHDVRLLFRWPLRSQGKTGQGGQSFRTLVSGQLLQTNEPDFGAINLYYFQPRTYVKAP